MVWHTARMWWFKARFRGNIPAVERVNTKVAEIDKGVNCDKEIIS